MPDNNKIQELLQKLKACIERGDLDACVEEAAQMAEEMGLEDQKLLNISDLAGVMMGFDFRYVLTLAAAQKLKGNAKAKAFFDAGVSAHILKKLDKAEEKYKQAIASNPKYAEAHHSYAILLYELKRNEEAEEQFKQAIATFPINAEAHHSYAILLSEIKRNKEAEEQFKQALAIDPEHASSHFSYGFLLMDSDRREEAKTHIRKASDLNFRAGSIIDSHLAKAFFYQAYSDNNFNRKRFKESSEDGNEAGEEFLKAAENASLELKDYLIQHGTMLIAKSFVRKIPEKSWYKSIFYMLGKNPDIPELIENLKNAAIWYEKASQCTVGERKDICNACFISIRVFSETLGAMSAFKRGNDAEINIDKWTNSLDFAFKIYTEKKLENGTALVDTLKQLIKCVNELAEHQKIGLTIQEERLGKCYNNLIDVSEKLDGALKIIAEHSVEAIRDYAKKRGMGFIGDEKPKKSIIDNWLIKGLIGAIIAIFLGIISGIMENRFFGYTWVLDKLNSTESVFRGFFNQ